MRDTVAPQPAPIAEHGRTTDESSLRRQRGHNGDADLGFGVITQAT